MRGLCLLAAVASLCGVMGFGCAKKEAAPGPAVTVSESAGPGSASRSVTATATVEEVDQAKREVVLRTADGELKRIHVGDEVRNLPQVRKGDVVTATYYESIALALRDATGEKPSVSVTQDDSLPWTISVGHSTSSSGTLASSSSSRSASTAALL